jgi:S1-C subfamily serine protease
LITVDFLKKSELRKTKKRSMLLFSKKSGSAKEPSSSAVGKYIQIFGLMLAVGVTGSFYMKKEGIGPERSGAATGATVSSAEENPVFSAGQFRPVIPVSSESSAIVSVQTSWGKGTGFFIQENAVITSRHVVESDPVKLAAWQKRVEHDRSILALEEEKLNSYQARLKNMDRGGSKDELKLLISERKKHLADFRFRHEKDEQRLAEQQKAREHPALKIILSDGSEQSASLMRVSREYDLALLISAPVRKRSVLKPAPRCSLLRAGDVVFVPDDSVRSDAGLTTGISTGIFSGYRRVGVQNRMFLQIDGKISPDQSGGPVLDAAGYVRGVVTRAIRADKGAGFAVPVDKVFDEFAAVLAGAGRPSPDKSP